MRNWKLYLVGVAFIATAVGVNYGYTAVTEEKVVTTVSRTDRECKTEGNQTNCRYVVYTPEEVFENVDSWWYLKFNSSDFNNKLVPGKKYELTVYGLRVPFFSWYRNVVDYTEIVN